MGLDLYIWKNKGKENKKVGYFRKVNFLVAFFSNIKGKTIENLDPICITKEDVEELLNRCNEVLKDNSKAKELLPTQEGFFFGDTDYNDYYFEDVKMVRDYLEDTLIPEFDNLDSDENIKFEIWF